MTMSVFHFHWQRIWPLARLALLVLVVLSAVAAFLLWRQWTLLVGRPDSQDVLQVTPKVSRLSPPYLLPLLEGTSAETLVKRALEAGQVDSADILLSWEASIPPTVRLDALNVLLRQRSHQDPLTKKEAWLLYTTAILHPHLSDEERLNVLLSLLEGEHDANVRKATIHSVVALLATSPALRPTQRQSALAALRQTGVFGTPIPPPLAPGGKQQLTPVFQVPLPSPTLPDDVRRARQRRQEAARALIRTPTRLTRVKTLANALRAEDLARHNFYENAIVATPTPYQHLLLAWDQMKWDTWRVMIAQRVFGISIVPEWEHRAEQLQFRRIKAWERFVAQASDWVATQPDIAQADQGNDELWSWVAWAGESGLYPRYPRDEIWRILRQAQETFFTHPEAPWRPWVTWDAKLGMYVLEKR